MSMLSRPECEGSKTMPKLYNIKKISSDFIMLKIRKIRMNYLCKSLAEVTSISW